MGLSGKPVVWDLDQLCYKELPVTATFATVPSSWTRALGLMAESKVQTRLLVTEMFPLTGWPEALAAFEQRRGMKLAFQP